MLEEQKNKSQAGDWCVEQCRRIGSTRVCLFCPGTLGRPWVATGRTMDIEAQWLVGGSRVAPVDPAGELVAGQLSLNHSVGRTLSLGRYYATAKAIAY